jgi:hypothetical protein
METNNSVSQLANKAFAKADSSLASQKTEAG